MAVEIITKDDLQAFKAELLEELKSFIAQPFSARKEWLKSEDVREMLGISAGSLQNLRVNGFLPFTKMGGTIYYEYADVVKVFEKNKRGGGR